MMKTKVPRKCLLILFQLKHKQKLSEYYLWTPVFSLINQLCDELRYTHRSFALLSCTHENIRTVRRMKRSGVSRCVNASIRNDDKLNTKCCSNFSTKSELRFLLVFQYKFELVRCETETHRPSCVCVSMETKDTEFLHYENSHREKS